MTKFKSGIRPDFLKQVRSLAVVTILTLGLGGCLSGYGTQLALLTSHLHQAQKNPETFMQTLRDNPNDIMWSQFLGEMLLYVPDDYSQKLTADRDTFMGAVVGTLLNNHPHFTYDTVDKTIPGRISAEELEFYKLSSNVWMETVMQSEEAVEMKALYALFQQRVGSNGPFTFAAIRTLLKDEVAFAKFINYDDYAREWMLVNVGGGLLEQGALFDASEKIRDGIIPQITIPVLPNTAS